MVATYFSLAELTEIFSFSFERKEKENPGHFVSDIGSQFLYELVALFIDRFA
jgi:hypothetical protein